MFVLNKFYSDIFFVNTQNNFFYNKIFINHLRVKIKSKDFSKKISSKMFS